MGLPILILGISTHALTGRATLSGRRRWHLRCISTHALTWRATDLDAYVIDEFNFYPRPHMEGDFPPIFTVGQDEISTHALTWRATKHL